MADLFEEGLASLAEAAKWREWPRRRAGKRPHIATLIRWAQNGVRVGGESIKLETVRVGRTLCTSRAAVSRFLRRLSAADGMAPATTTPTSAAQLEADAEAILAAAGV